MTDARTAMRRRYWRRLGEEGDGQRAKMRRLKWQGVRWSLARIWSAVCAGDAGAAFEELQPLATALSQLRDDDAEGKR